MLKNKQGQAEKRIHVADKKESEEGREQSREGRREPEKEEE